VSGAASRRSSSLSPLIFEQDVCNLSARSSNEQVWQ
jgi:hypothetical protein